MTTITSHVLSPTLVAVANTGNDTGAAHLQQLPNVALFGHGPPVAVFGRMALLALREAVNAALATQEV